MSLCIGQLPEFCSVDRIVLTDVDIVRVIGNIQIRAIGNIAECLVRRRRDRNCVNVSGRFLICSLGPLARNDISCLAVLVEIHRNRCELLMRAALQKQDFVVVGNVHELAKILLGFFDDSVKDLSSVAHFHNRHTASAVIEHFFLCFFKNFYRQYCGTGRKVINSCHLVFSSLGCYAALMSLY